MTTESVLAGTPWQDDLGERATLLQFSSAFCAPCRTTRVVLADVAAGQPGVVHVEVDAETVPVDGPLTLSALVDRVVAAHPGGRLPQVLEACSVLVGDRPVKSLDPATVMVQPGESVEFLPPFAGG